jgi:hypothetical protein
VEEVSARALGGGDHPSDVELRSRLADDLDPANLTGRVAI